MLASVYDRATGQWQYFEVTGKPENGRVLSSAVGIGVEDALPRLPSGSRPVGKGSNPRGTVLANYEGSEPSAFSAITVVGLMLLALYYVMR